jgi:hypothetical protein
VKLVGDTAMLVIGLALVVGGVQGVVGHKLGEPNSPDPRPSETATVYVGGTKGESYWLHWGDFCGDLKGHTEGVVGDKLAIYVIDLSQAPTDGSDTLEVRAGKSERAEGTLTVAVEVGDELVGGEYTSEAEPALSEMYISHTLDSRAH